MALAALSRRQDGVFSVGQLDAAGFGRRRLPRLVQQGRFVRRHRGVYGDALVKPTQRAHLLGALLAFGDSAFLSRRTALALHGVRLVNLRAIEVTVVAEHIERRTGLRGIPHHFIAPDAERDRVKYAWVQRRRMAILQVTEFASTTTGAESRPTCLGLLDLHSARS